MTPEEAHIQAVFTEFPWLHRYFPNPFTRFCDAKVRRMDFPFLDLWRLGTEEWMLLTLMFDRNGDPITILDDTSWEGTLARFVRYYYKQERVINYLRRLPVSTLSRCTYAIGVHAPSDYSRGNLIVYRAPKDTLARLIAEKDRKSVV